MTTKSRQLLQRFENLTGAAWVASEGGRMSESGVEKAFWKLDAARGELIEYIESLENTAGCSFQPIANPNKAAEAKALFGFNHTFGADAKRLIHGRDSQ